MFLLKRKYIATQCQTWTSNLDLEPFEPNLSYSNLSPLPLHYHTDPQKLPCSRKLLRMLKFSWTRTEVFIFLFVYFRTHGNFNSKEVGAELAQSLLTLFDPTLDGMLLETETQQDQLLIPIYTKPKTVSAVLPGVNGFF